jgi:hypothetical protein
MMNYIGPNQDVKANGVNVIGPNANVRGNRNTITGPNANVHGDDNIITGPNAHVWGNRNRITGPNARVHEGVDNVIHHGDDLESIASGHSGSTQRGTKPKKKPSRKREREPDVVIMGTNHGIAQLNTTGAQDALSFITDIFSGVSGVKKPTPVILDETQYVRGPPPSDVKHDRVAEEGAIVCAICLERAACCVASPCMHACYCVACARHLCFGESGADLFERGKVKCAKCREPVHSIKHIFI